MRSAISHVEGHASSKVGLCIYFVFAAICLHLSIILSYGQILSPARLSFGLAMVLYLPLISIIIVPALWRILWVPARYSRIYRQSSALQSEMRVTISSRGFTRDSDSDASLRASWNTFRYWREFRNIFLLVDAANDGEIEAINTAGLPGWQREQLRELLSGLLPKKSLQRARTRFAGLIPYRRRARQKALTERYANMPVRVTAISRRQWPGSLA